MVNTASTIVGVTKRFCIFEILSVVQTPAVDSNSGHRMARQRNPIRRAMRHRRTVPCGVDQISPLIPHTHLLAVGEHGFCDTPDGSAILGHSSHGDSDLISGLECLGGEAKVDQGGRSVPLTNPMYDAALVILGIELQ